MFVHWQVEVQILLPLVQAMAYLGVRWPVVEAHEEKEVHLEEEVQVGGGRVQVVEVCKVRVVADGHGVREAEVGHEVQGQVEVLGS